MQERAQLTWVRLAANPDREAILREIADRQLRDLSAKPAPLRISTVGSFLVGHSGPGLPFQAVAFVPHDMRLLHWTFPAWAGDGDDAPWRRLLASCSWPPGDDREWALFGARVLLPRAFQPREVEAVAGAVTLTFTRRDGLVVTVRQLALARRLLAERPLKALVRRHLLVSEKARILELAENAVRGGCPAVHATWSVRGERPWDRVAWRRWPGESWTWHDATVNRVYDFAQVGPAKAPRLDPDHACPA